MSRDIIEEVAAAPSFQEAAERLTDWARELTGCEAAMLRFREDDPDTGSWIPALVERGFGCGFVRDEMLIGEEECLCGRICRGCVDESYPFFTPGGSFSWGGFQTVAEEYPLYSLGKIRGRCIAEGFESVLIVPLVADGSSIGCLHLADFAPGKFEAHVETLEAVCRLSGAGLLRFSAQDRQGSVIRAVETVLTPPGLHQIRGFDIAVSYSSATETAHLGGDFYEVIELDDGDVLLVVGDYSGKGISAAGMAARARHIIAAAALDSPSPEELLATAHARLTDTLPPGRFVTAVACRYSPDGTLAAAVAGHPFPLILEADGGAAELALPGNPPLGFCGDKPLRGGTTRLEPNQTLLLYTDGISESRSEGVLFGIEGIAAYWHASHDSPLADVTAGLCQRSADFHQRDLEGDDRLALAARLALTPSGPPSRPARSKRR